MTSTIIVPLAPEHKSLAAAALARAFSDDPLQRYIFPDEQARAACSPGYFSALLEYAIKFGDVFSTPEATHGVAASLGPGLWELTDERAAAAGINKLGTMLGEDAAARFFGIVAALDRLHRQGIPREHWFVMMVGVCPSVQGAGFGRALLQPVLDRADADGLPVLLETAQPKNVGFYLHLGFDLVTKAVDPESGLNLWAFRRDPGKRPAGISLI